MRSLPHITIKKKYHKLPEYLKEVDSLALANTQLNLEKAFKNYFKNPKHFRLPKCALAFLKAIERLCLFPSSEMR